MDRDHRVERRDLQHPHDAGIVRDDRDPVGGSRRGRDGTHPRGVEERALAQVQHDVRLFGGLGQRLFERGSSRHVEVAVDVHDGAIVEQLELDGEVDPIPHLGRV